MWSQTSQVRVYFHTLWLFSWTITQMVIVLMKFYLVILWITKINQWSHSSLSDKIISVFWTRVGQFVLRAPSSGFGLPVKLPSKRSLKERLLRKQKTWCRNLTQNRAKRKKKRSPHSSWSNRAGHFPSPWWAGISIRYETVFAVSLSQQQKGYSRFRIYRLSPCRFRY